MSDDARAHLVWEVRQMLAHITPADCTDTELRKVIAALAPAHSRWLDAQPAAPRTPVLSLVREAKGRNHPA